MNMDNQTRNELKRKKHAEEQAQIIRLRNAQIATLQAEKGRLQRALQERPETPSEALIERAEQVEKERDALRAEVNDLWPHRKRADSLAADLAAAVARAEEAERSRDTWRRYAKGRTATIREQAALIETLRAEVNELWPLRKRAVKAEKERDEARAKLAKTTEQLHDALDEQSRGFTAEDVDDAARKCAFDAFCTEWKKVGSRTSDAVNAAIDAALTPATETFESVVGDVLTEYMGGYLNGDEVPARMRARLAALGRKKEN